VSQLGQYKSDELMGIGTRQMPGSWVRHRDDKQSFGMVVAKVGDQVEVLWSKQPFSINIQKEEIYVAPVPRRSHVNFVQGPDHMSPGFKEIASYELQESYEYGDINSVDVEQMTKRGDHVTLHQDGRVEVERKVEKLPWYVKPEDVHVRRSRW